jgi:hypothetical protein
VDDDTRVGFAFLEDNPDAIFVHGDATVPVQKGSLVVFLGVIPHQTRIYSHQPVRFLGPFTFTDNQLSTVTWDLDEPSSAPSNNPSSTPSNAPSKTPSSAPSSAPSNAPIASPSTAPTFGSKGSKGSKGKGKKGSKASKIMSQSGSKAMKARMTKNSRGSKI